MKTETKHTPEATMNYKILVDTGESIHELPDAHLYSSRTEAEKARKAILQTLAESLSLDDTAELIIVEVKP
jgi:hypothetical protein